MMLLEYMMFFALIVNVYKTQEAKMKIDVKLSRNIITKPRNTINELFNLLHFNITDIPRRKYTALYKYMEISRIRFKRIVKISRVNRKNYNNISELFITHLNELLNGNVDEFRIFSTPKYIAEVLLIIRTYFGKVKKIFDARVKEKDNNNNNASITNDETTLKNISNVYSDKDELWPSMNSSVRDPSRRIFEGKTVDVRYYTFMASIHVYDRFQAAGSVITANVIITAASGLQTHHKNRYHNIKPKLLSVRVGSSYYGFDGQLIPAKRTHYHPWYNPDTLNHNLCLVELVKAVNLVDRFVKRIEFDRSPWALPLDTEVVILGWGARDKANKIWDWDKGMLSYARLQHYSLRDCQKAYSRKYVTKQNFCAGTPTGNGACKHDAGAPAVVDKILVGVASFGSPICGDPDRPTVFTKIGFYSDWIDAFVNKATQRKKKRSLRTTTEPSVNEIYINNNKYKRMTTIPKNNAAIYENNNRKPTHNAKLDNIVRQTNIADKKSNSKSNSERHGNIILAAHSTYKSLEEDIKNVLKNSSLEYSKLILRFVNDLKTEINENIPFEKTVFFERSVFSPTQDDALPEFGNGSLVSFDNKTADSIPADSAPIETTPVTTNNGEDNKADVMESDGEISNANNFNQNPYLAEEEVMTTAQMNELRTYPEVNRVAQDDTATEIKIDELENNAGEVNEEHMSKSEEERRIKLLTYIYLGDSELLDTQNETNNYRQKTQYSLSMDSEEFYKMLSDNDIYDILADVLE